MTPTLMDHHVKLVLFPSFAARCRSFPSVTAVGGATGELCQGGGRSPSVSERPPASLLIAPSSDAASSPNWPGVGVDGVKMAAALFTSTTAACQIRGRLSEARGGGAQGASLPVYWIHFFSIMAANKSWDLKSIKHRWNQSGSNYGRNK